MILKITFNGVPDVDDEIEFHFDPNFPSLPAYDFTRGNVFKVTRSNPGEVTRGTDGITQAAFYEAAFILDYITNFTISRIDNVVFIEALNGSSLFDYSCDSGLVVFEIVDDSESNNMIHVINIQPRQYAAVSLSRDYLITEDDYFIITEDNKKIRL